MREIVFSIFKLKVLYVGVEDFLQGKTLYNFVYENMLQDRKRNRSYLTITDFHNRDRFRISRKRISGRKGLISAQIE